MGWLPHAAGFNIVVNIFFKNEIFSKELWWKMALLLCLWLLVNVQRRLSGLNYSLILNDRYYKASWREALFTAIRSDWGCLPTVLWLHHEWGLIEYKPFRGGLVGCVSWQRPLFLFFFFPLSHFFLFFSAGKWWHSSGQWSQVLQG